MSKEAKTSYFYVLHDLQGGEMEVCESYTMKTISHSKWKSVWEQDLDVSDTFSQYLNK